MREVRRVIGAVGKPEKPPIQTVVMLGHELFAPVPLVLELQWLTAFNQSSRSRCDRDDLRRLARQSKSPSGRHAARNGGPLRRRTGEPAAGPDQSQPSQDSQWLAYRAEAADQGRMRRLGPGLVQPRSRQVLQQKRVHGRVLLGVPRPSIVSINYCRSDEFR